MMQAPAWSTSGTDDANLGVLEQVTLKESTHGRIGGLDGMRGIAAMGVLLYHYTFIYRLEFGHTFPAWIDFHRGLYGVQLFFMISGFVIFMTAKSCRTWGEFLIKRISRLYPTYWACLAITFTLTTIFFVSEERSTTWQEGLFNLTMLQGMFHVKEVDGAYWSLYPELLFYAVICLVMFFRGLRYVQWVGVLWMMVELHGPIHVPGITLDLQWGTFFLAGITGYKIAVLKERTWWNYGYFALTFVVNLIAHRNFVAYPVVYLCFTLFVFDKAPFFAHPWLRYLGGISYALYLIHQNVGYLIIRGLVATGMPDVLAMLMAIGCVILIAHTVTYRIEKPLIPRFRKALFWMRDKFTRSPDATLIGT